MPATVAQASRAAKAVAKQLHKQTRHDQVCCHCRVHSIRAGNGNCGLIMMHVLVAWVVRVAVWYCDG